MFVEVHIPDHSPDHRGFSYFVPEFLRSQIVRGCVVEVPLKDELVPAVVTLLGVNAPERGEAKAVAGILLHERVLAEYQIDAAYALAEKYFVFFHAVVSFFLPPAVLRRHLKTLKGYSSLPLSEPTIKENPRTPTVVYDRNGLGPEGIFGTRFPLDPGTALILPSDAAVRRFLEKTDFSQDDFFVHRSDMPEAFDFKFRLAAALREKPFLV
jgi:primosomal protein N'